MREGGNIWAGDDRKTDEDERSSGRDARDGLALPQEAEGDENENGDEGKDERERFCEIGEAQGESHESSVTKVVCGEMFQQSGDCEEKKRQEEGIGADFAHAEFALR